jgi:hypothetical protein
MVEKYFIFVTFANQSAVVGGDFRRGTSIDYQASLLAEAIGVTLKFTLAMRPEVRL